MGAHSSADWRALAALRCWQIQILAGVAAEGAKTRAYFDIAMEARTVEFSALSDRIASIDDRHRMDAAAHTAAHARHEKRSTPTTPAS
jgi:hypothetical protein